MAAPIAGRPALIAIGVSIAPTRATAGEGQMSSESRNIVSPRPKNAMVGFLAGAFLVCVIIVVLELLNDTIQKEDDIERYLGIPTLAVIPEKTNAQKKGKSVDGTKKINLKGKAK